MSRRHEGEAGAPKFKLPEAPPPACGHPKCPNAPGVRVRWKGKVYLACPPHAQAYRNLASMTGLPLEEETL